MSAAASSEFGRSRVPSLRMSTSMPCSTGQVGVAKVNALACRSHRSGVKPPLQLGCPTVIRSRRKYFQPTRNNGTGHRVDGKRFRQTTLCGDEDLIEGSL